LFFSRTTCHQLCIHRTSKEWRFQQGSAYKEVMKIQRNSTVCLTLKNRSALLFWIQTGGLSRGQSRTKTSVVFKGFSLMIGEATAIGNNIKNMFSNLTLRNVFTTLNKKLNNLKLFNSTKYSTISKYPFFAIWLLFGSFVPFGRYLKLFFRNLSWSLQFFDDDQNFLVNVQLSTKFEFIPSIFSVMNVQV